MEAADVIQRQLRVMPEHGLHLSPISQLVRKAMTFTSSVSLSFDGRRADVKSAFDLMLLAAPCGAIVTLECSGPDATVAADAITDLFAGGFAIPGHTVG